MNKSVKWIIEGVFVIVVGIIIYSVADGSKEGNKAYLESVISFQEDVKENLLNDEQSPVKEEDKSNIKINFFEPDPDFKVVADIEWYGFKELVMVPTTKGLKRRYLKAAKASFQLKGQDCTLELLKMEMPLKGKENLIMLSFSDLSSGRETYGGGRYINIENVQNGQQKLEIDFNKALNLYCAYNEDYDCALPLRENQLAIKILAGEKQPTLENKH